MKIGKPILVIALTALASTAQATMILTTHTRANVADGNFDYNYGVGTSISSFSSADGNVNALSRINPNQGAPILQSYVRQTGVVNNLYGGGGYAEAYLQYTVTIVGPDGLVPVLVNAAGNVNADGSGSVSNTFASLSIFSGAFNSGPSGGVGVDLCAGSAWYSTCNGATSFTYSDTLQVSANQMIEVIMKTSAQLTGSTAGSVTSWVDPTFEIDPAYASQYKIVYSAEVDQPSNNVPEPASIALLGLGFAGMGVLRRRKKS